MGREVVCQSQKGGGRTFACQRKKEICVGELLRSGILAKIMAQVYMSVKQEGLNG